MPKQSTSKAKAATGAGGTGTSSVPPSTERRGEVLPPPKLPDSRQEAVVLVAFANQNTPSASQREDFMAAVQWECARHGYYHGMLPEFYRLAAEKRRPDSSTVRNTADDVFDSSDFPATPWAKLPEDAKRLLLRLLCGDQSKGARLLNAYEGYPQALRFVKWRNAFDEECPLDELEKRQKDAPRFMPMDDGGAVVLVRIYPGCGWGKITSDLQSELKDLNLPTLSQDGRMNANDVNHWAKVLKGLAALWLEKAQTSRAEQNKLIYPTQGKKADYASLEDAKRKAQAEVDAMVNALVERCERWTKWKKESVAGEEAFFRCLRDAMKPKRTKNKQRGKP
ncbi:MAG: hypothetical protein IAE77_30865 [Prosthecobacter sp.]|uniref:hypothetical protein n=1 Tax=Prosthecobacter sp. TaxID=1965333 RepID=UPI0019DDEB44|nr:hypothetical protein [Prosthecobacter sp.]MBE2287899.1 hypothetical protein [Prosthecobacter sp.]